MPRADFEYDGWFLWRKHGAAPWRACRHNPRTGQVDRPSLGTRDLQEAKRRLIAHAAAHPPPGLRVPAGLTVAEACLRYWHEHAKEVPSREAQALSAAQRANWRSSELSRLAANSLPNTSELGAMPSMVSVRVRAG